MHRAEAEGIDSALATRRIRALPEHVVNQIAAGEVVERPASVVKELLENAIDADAAAITVELERGGIELIRVTDDGVGIPPDELASAIAPHATSKIDDAEDLISIRSMGFRGEALSAIASVSRLAIRSRPRDGAAEACELRVEGERRPEVRPTSGPRGTSVEVRNLFFNTPARRRFLRTPQTEQGHCVEVVRNIAIGQPRLAVRLVVDGRVALDLPPEQDQAGRIIEALGAEVDDFIEVGRRGVDADDAVAVWGLIGRPSAARATTRAQRLFINGRMVRDRTVQHALQEAYRGLIDPGRKPAAALCVRIDPSLVDVNVHPAKAEVRFRDSGAVHSAVLRAVREALRGEDLTPSWPSQGASNRNDSAGAGWSAAALAARLGDLRPGQGFDYEALRAAVERESAQAPASPAAGEAPTELPTPRPAPRVLQVHDSFLVTEDEHGVVIIDQHALHERVMFEKIMDRVRAGSLQSQRLLTPATVPATAAQLEALERLGPLLARLGVEAEPIGPAAAAVQAFPTLLFDRRIDPAEFLAELLERAEHEDLAQTEESAIHAVVDMMACKAAVKAGDRLGDEELAELLALRERVERSSACPHGRPTTIRLSVRDLERQFGRR